MIDFNPTKTPIDPNVKLCAESTTDSRWSTHELKETPYAKIVGNLLYLSQVTRLDISFAVNKIASFSKDPRKEHWTAAKKILW